MGPFLFVNVMDSLRACKTNWAFVEYADSFKGVQIKGMYFPSSENCQGPVDFR